MSSQYTGLNTAFYGQKPHFKEKAFCAGVATSPEDWCRSGYHEIQKPPQRYIVVDTHVLFELFGVEGLEQYQQIHKGWIDDAMKAENKQRIQTRTQDLAVGGRDYVTKVKSALDVAGKHRTVVADDSVYALKEPVSA